MTDYALAQRRSDAHAHAAMHVHTSHIGRGPQNRKRCARRPGACAIHALPSFDDPQRTAEGVLSQAEQDFIDSLRIER